jgi:hypothetical protein
MCGNPGLTPPHGQRTPPEVHKLDSARERNVKNIPNAYAYQCVEINTFKETKQIVSK